MHDTAPDGSPVTHADFSRSLDSWARRQRATNSRRGGAPLFVAVLAIMAVLLIYDSRPRTVGDARDYLLMAQSISGLEPPIYSPAELQRGIQRLNAVPGFPTDIILHRLPLSDGRVAIDHMWIYSALAAPGVAVAGAIGLHPNYAFALLNLVLLLGAAWMVANRAGVLIAGLLSMSVLIWWLDKAHTEIFTVSLLAIAVVTLRDRPILSMAALGLVAAQNIAAAPLLPLAAGISFAERRTLRDREVWMGFAFGLALAAIHVGWYLALIGRPTAPIIQGGGFHIPTFPEATSFLFDLNMGLLPHATILLGLVLASLVVLIVRARQGLANGAVLFAGFGLLILLVAFSQTTNLHAGGTVGPHRYGLWLMPMSIPVFMQMRSAFPRAFTLAAAPAILISGLIALAFYAPARREGWLQPTWLADAVWRNVPTLDNPFAEIFYERVGHRELPPIRSIGFADCTKVLVVGGQWPDDCALDIVLAPECMQGACYANRSASGYTISPSALRGTQAVSSDR